VHFVQLCDKRPSHCAFQYVCPPRESGRSVSTLQLMPEVTTMMRWSIRYALGSEPAISRLKRAKLQSPPGAFVEKMHIFRMLSG
jgi:hypothetical protein